MMRLAPILMAVSMALPLAAQHEAPASLHSEVVEITGTIARIHLVPGEGTPYLEVSHGIQKTTVRLGPMQYLIEVGFNPKSGQEVAVKGYRVDGRLAAIEVMLPAVGKTFRLRDDDGRPLWQGARRRRGRRGSHQQ